MSIVLLNCGIVSVRTAVLDVWTDSSRAVMSGAASLGWTADPSALPS